MQNLYDEVATLDQRCYEQFFLSEDILMEHAADGMADYIRANFVKKSKVIVACGSGNNGADGIALARLLHKDYEVEIFYVKEPKSPMALLQAKRAEALGISTCFNINECDILVDAIVGTGFSGEFDEVLSAHIERMNALNAFKIACDVPSGYRFEADVTLSMGALKKRMFLDSAKDVVGEIKVLDLGISRELYEVPSNWKVLDIDDLKLPYRGKKSSHKGSFGHLCVACGEKSGASIMSAKAALRFGVGLVSLVGFEELQIPQSLMYTHELPLKTTAIALGMGLGDAFSDAELELFLENELPLIADADIFFMPVILEILKRKNVVLTPHPKEFVSLLKLSNIANIGVEELQNNRFEYARKFCGQFPHAVLLLKGANVIIGRGDEFYVNPHGNVVLAKGGSGDVLSGLIASLLAQGHTALDAAINGSLAHTKLALNYKGADFSLIPDDLIEGIGKL